MKVLEWAKGLVKKGPQPIMKKTHARKKQGSKYTGELKLEEVSAQFFYLQGSITGRIECQDTYGMYDKHAGEFSFYAIFDGHGTSGKEASNTACEFMLGFIEKQAQHIIDAMPDSSTIPDLLNDMFAKADKNLKTCGVDMDLSGTTCTCVLIKGETLFVANVGDSRAVLGRISETNRLAIELTQDHRPYVKGERERVVRAGGKVKRLTNKQGELSGPLRVWADQHGPGLALTRSLGDFMSKKIGFSSKPVIEKLSLKEFDHFLVIATDGLWDVLNSSEVVTFILKLGQEKSQAAKLLASEARAIWNDMARLKQIENKIGDMPGSKATVDDISVICIFFRYEGVEYLSGYKPVKPMEQGILGQISMDPEEKKAKDNPEDQIPVKQNMPVIPEDEDKPLMPLPPIIVSSVVEPLPSVVETEPTDQNYFLNRSKSREQNKKRLSVIEEEQLSKLNLGLDINSISPKERSDVTIMPKTKDIAIPVPTLDEDEASSYLMPDRLIPNEKDLDIDCDINDSLQLEAINKFQQEAKNVKYKSPGLANSKKVSELQTKVGKDGKKLH
jgi:integrin-linked kinase-associated serine/threonine phosphatase 2C